MNIHPRPGERAAWVLSRAGRSAGARRRGETLSIAARRAGRASSGASAATSVEAVTPHLLSRALHRADGEAKSFRLSVAVVIGFCLLGLLVWPAAIIAHVVYMAWVLIYGYAAGLRERMLAVDPGARVRHLPAPQPVPLVVVAVVLGVAVMIYRSHTGATGMQATWRQIQPVLGVAWAAWMTRAWGWAAITTSDRADRTGPVTIKKQRQVVIKKQPQTPDTAPSDTPSETPPDLDDGLPMILDDLDIDASPETSARPKIHLKKQTQHDITDDKDQDND